MTDPVLSCPIDSVKSPAQNPFHHDQTFGPTHLAVFVFAENGKNQSYESPVHRLVLSLSANVWIKVKYKENASGRAERGQELSHHPSGGARQRSTPNLFNFVRLQSQSPPPTG